MLSDTEQRGCLVLVQLEPEARMVPVAREVGDGHASTLLIADISVMLSALPGECRGWRGSGDRSRARTDRVERRARAA
jgi:hypothetical protein